MPSAKKQKLTKIEKMRRKIKSHTIHTRPRICPNTWARSENLRKSCGKLLIIGGETHKRLKLKD